MPRKCPGMECTARWRQCRRKVYVFETDKEAQRAAQLDIDLALRCGLSLERIYRVAAWLLTDGANPHRLYHYKASGAAEAAYVAYRDKHKFVECTGPDERTPHWKLLFG
jgi:hypothetical protein